MAWGTLNRSPQEVAGILRQFIVGEPTGFAADDFVTVPITNTTLDDIRVSFDDLVKRHPRWEPQMPFPESGVPELQSLIDRAELVVATVDGAS